MKHDQETLLLDLIIKTLEKLDKTTESMDERLDKIDLTLVRNTASLEEHVKRTNALEDRIKTEVEPAIKFYNGFIFLGKVIGILALVVTIAGGIFESLKFISSRM